MTKKTNFHQLTREELNQALLDRHTDLITARKSHASNDLANPMRIRQLKRDIARIKTALAQQLINNKEEK